MEKINNLFSIKVGETVKFKAKLFGKERDICGKFEDFCDNDYGWLIYVSNYVVEGVLIDNVDNTQGFTMPYGGPIYRLD